MGASLRFSVLVCGPSPPLPHAQNLFSDRMEGPLRNVTLDWLYQECPEFQKFHCVPAGHKPFSSDLGQGRGNFRSNSQPDDASQEHTCSMVGRLWWGAARSYDAAIPSSTAPPDSISSILGWSHTQTALRLCFVNALDCLRYRWACYLGGISWSLLLASPSLSPLLAPN